MFMYLSSAAVLTEALNKVSGSRENSPTLHLSFMTWNTK